MIYDICEGMPLTQKGLPVRPGIRWLLDALQRFRRCCPAPGGDGHDIANRHPHGPSLVLHSQLQARAL